jgi:hypothetical protein
LKARYLWEEWHLVQQQQPTVGFHEQQHHILTWERPLCGWYKCNIDAAFYQELNKTCTGWCLRDHMGRFIMAATTWMDGNYSVVEGEAIALTEALKVVEQKGISQVIFETGSKSVVDAIHRPMAVVPSLVLLLLVSIIFYLVIQTSRLSLLSGERIWLQERPFFGLVAVPLRHYLTVLLCYCIMK